MGECFNHIRTASTATMVPPDLTHDQAFENTSTNVAASQMRNALNKLADTVTNPEEKKVSNLMHLLSTLSSLYAAS